MTPLMIADAETFFINSMTSEYPTMQLIFANDDPPDTQAIYSCIHVMASEDVIPINLGITSKSRNVGVVQVDVFAPPDVGAGAARERAFYIAGQFKRRVANVGVEGTVTYKDPSIVSRGQVSGRYKYMMRIPYRYDFTF